MATKFEIFSDALKNGKSPLLDSWPLFDDPSSVLLIVMAYIVFVLYAGPKLMENRKPFNLRLVIILYNAVQVYYNCWMLKKSFVEPTFWKYLFSFSCAQVTPQEEQVYQTLICVAFWHMTMLKLMDLLDTVFFVLCKKQSHITFLHVQHHVLSATLLWIAGKYFTGQEFTVVFFCNTIVHVIMYFYYFVAALGPQYKKYIWWKQYLTIAQMVQFVIIICYMTASIWVGCGYNQRIIWLIISNASMNLVLFLNFFFHTYDSKKLINEKMSVCGRLQDDNLDISAKSEKEL